MTEPRLLFVYGTLMSTARGDMGHAQRARLDTASRVVGPATIAGYLFDLGDYPGLVLQLPLGAAASIGRVSGEVRALDNPDEMLAWLDRYEGIRTDDPTGSEYRREAITVRLEKPADEARELQAWVYIYQGPLMHGRLVVDGRWRR